MANDVTRGAREAGSERYSATSIAASSDGAQGEVGSVQNGEGTSEDPEMEQRTMLWVPTWREVEDTGYLDYRRLYQRSCDG